MVLGTVIYNEILKIPVFGFEEAVYMRREYIREKNSSEAKFGEDFIGFVPGAIYQYAEFTDSSGRAGRAGSISLVK